MARVSRPISINPVPKVPEGNFRFRVLSVRYTLQSAERAPHAKAKLTFPDRSKLYMQLVAWNGHALRSNA